MKSVLQQAIYIQKEKCTQDLVLAVFSTTSQTHDVIDVMVTSHILCLPQFVSLFRIRLFRSSYRNTCKNTKKERCWSNSSRIYWSPLVYALHLRIPYNLKPLVSLIRLKCEIVDNILFESTNLIWVKMYWKEKQKSNVKGNNSLQSCEINHEQENAKIH